MLKKLVTSLAVFTLIVFSYFLASADQAVFDEKISDIKISKDKTVVGYRKNTGDATVSFTYHYFYLGNDDKELPERTPFLITKSSESSIIVNGNSSIQIAIAGEILSFRNRAWAEVDGKLEPLEIDITASYQ